MDRRQIGLKLVMDGLGLRVKVDDFDDRLILQKAVYLAQAAKVRLGYHYRWYLRGPYCPSVAEDGFAVSAEQAQGANDAEDWELDASSSTRLEDIRAMLLGGDCELRAKRLELLASVHFLIVNHQANGRNPAQITRTLKRYGKDFTESDVQDAVEELVAHEILP